MASVVGSQLMRTAYDLEEQTAMARALLVRALLVRSAYFQVSVLVPKAIVKSTFRSLSHRESQSTMYVLSADPSTQSIHCHWFFKNHRISEAVENSWNQEAYRVLNRDAPTLFGLDDSLHASTNFFKMKSVSRNVLKNGWCDSRHSEVNEWFRILVRRRNARGEGVGLPSPDSESALGAVMLNRVDWWVWAFPARNCWLGAGSESRRLVQSRSESLGTKLPL